MTTFPVRFAEKGDSYLAVDRSHTPTRVFFGPDAEAIKERVFEGHLHSVTDLHPETLEAKLQKHAGRGNEIRRVPA